MTYEHNIYVYIYIYIYIYERIKKNLIYYIIKVMNDI